MPVRALVYLNRAARGRFKIRSETVVSRLQDAGFAVDLQVVGTGREEAAPRIEGKDLAVVCGGDGTLHRILPYAVRAGLPIALLPAGTANVLAYEVGIPEQLEGALKVLFEGRTRRVNLGLADDQFFHLVAGIGTDGYLLLKVPGYLKRFFGIAAFWISGAHRFWRYPLPRFRLQSDGAEFEATFAILANSRYYGRHLRLAPQADVFERSLHLCVFSSTSHLRYLTYLWQGLSGRHINLPDVTYHAVATATATGPEGVFVQLDGEPAGHLPKHFRLAEEQLEIFAP